MKTVEEVRRSLYLSFLSQALYMPITTDEGDEVRSAWF